MKTPFLAVAIAALLGGHAVAGDKPHGDASRSGMRADTDGDGRVSRAEADAAATGRTGEWFDKLDLDKDGYVTQEEFSKARELRRGQAEAKFEEHFKTSDVNGDGQLSLDEVQAKMPDLAARFDRVDKDKNGLLSKEEMQRGRHRRPEPKT